MGLLDVLYPVVKSSDIEKLKTIGRAFIPGWSLYNKYRRGAEYELVGAASSYPEISEPCKLILTGISTAMGGPFAGAVAYSLVSMNSGATELQLERIMRDPMLHEYKKLELELERIREEGKKSADKKRKATEDKYSPANWK